MKVVHQAASVASEGSWILFNPITATKVDPNTDEVSAPTLVSGNRYQKTVDATVVRTSPSGMVGYYITTDIEWGSQWRFDYEHVVHATSVNHIASGVALATSTALTDGVWSGILGENVAMTNWDRWARSLATAIPAIGNQTGPPACIRGDHANVVGGKTEIQSNAMWYDKSDGSNVGQMTTRATANVLFTGTTKVIVAMMVGSRTIRTASETIDDELRYRFLTWD